MKQIPHLVVLLSLFVLAALTISPVQAEEKVYGDQEYNTIKTDGQLIPVGEKNRYRNTYNTWNIWANPFGWFFGNISVGASYAFHQNVKVNIEPYFIYAYYAKPKIVGGGATLSSSIFFNKMYDGFYLEPGARILYLSQDKTVGGGTISGIAGGPQLIGGWGWIWDSGFNINAGLGLGYYWGDVGDDVNDTDTFSGVFPAGNLQFGYTF